MKHQNDDSQRLIVRPASVNDATAVARVHANNGLDSLDIAEWKRRWTSYPFAHLFEEVPIGWVLESDTDGVVGTLSNIHLLYELGGIRLRAAIAGDWAVNAAYRFKSLNLTTAFFKQKNIELLLNGSANPTASKLLTGMRIPRVPIPKYAAPCFWPASPSRFALAALRRARVPMAAALSYPLGLMLSARGIFGPSMRAPSSYRTYQLPSFDERFDSIWQHIAAGSPRLRAVRTREVLEWRFDQPLRKGVTKILVVECSGVCVGYTVLTRRTGDDHGLRTFDIVDLQAVNDDPISYRSLILAAIELAEREGGDAVKLSTGTPAKREPAESLRPLTYSLATWQLYYRLQPKFADRLQTANDWDISPFDTY